MPNLATPPAWPLARRVSRYAGLFQLLLLMPALVLPNVVRSETDKEKQRYEKAIGDLKSAKDTYERWCFLGRAAKESLKRGRDADAKAFAEELETLAPKYRSDWNYGNAIQDSNIVLGQIALKIGEIEAAGKRLLGAGRSPGSPQMDTFGPNMSLAAELLKKGETAVVLEYFKLCEKFWKMDNGKLATWTKDVEEGRAPDFGANLVY